MDNFQAQHGLSTILNHYTEGEDPRHAHIAPIYQTSTFTFPDATTGAAIELGEQDGYIYTRLGNPNLEQLARKYALLEGLDLVRENPGTPPEQVVEARLFSSGMAAISAAVLSCLQGGGTLIAQQALYSNTYSLLTEIGPNLGIEVEWVHDLTTEGWRAALEKSRGARLVYAETPVNPTLQIVDLRSLADLAHGHDCWLMVDNTFATPYCQRPLSLGADLVVFSTTKYLSGHGAVTGGGVVCRHLDFVRGALDKHLTLMGGVPSPFEAWLANLGLRTFELRLERHCRNAEEIARYLEAHPKITRVNYPGLESHPGRQTAREQMSHFGGMLSFELEGGYHAGVTFLDSLKVATIAVSLGVLDTLVQHPASMTHVNVPPHERLKAGVSDGLIRMSVGIENVEDLLEDLDQALQKL